MYPINHVRRQLPSGQGFFHLGELDFGGARLVYLYDCGSTTGADARDDSMERYVHPEWTDVFRRGLFVLSHAHADHMNGIPRLVERDAMPSTVVLPYLDDLDRMIAFAGDARNEHDDAWSREFAVEGISALRARGVERIYEIQRGGDGGGDEPEDDGPGDDGPGDDGPGRDETWRAPGAQGLSAEPLSGGAAAVGDRSRLLPDTVPLVVRGRAGRPLWTFRFHVDEGRAGAKDRFRERLAAQILPDGGDLGAWLARPENRRALVTGRRAALLRAYGGSPRLNATSLSMYSGPTSHALRGRIVTRSVSDEVARTNTMIEPPPRTGWLGTGDACLGADDNLTSFLRHYAVVADEVATMSAPHHGSMHNSGSELYRALRPGRVVIAASPRAMRYRHPHFATVHAIGAAGAQMVVVNEDPGSEFSEWLRID